MRAIHILAGFMAVVALNAALLAQHGQDHAAMAEESKQVTIVGELIDAACFVHSGGDAKGAGHAECARDCLASGIPAGVLPQGAEASEMKILLTNPVPLAPHAAKTVRVEGTAYEGFERAVEPKAVYVQEGDEWKPVQLKDFHHREGNGHGAGHGH